jgi:hypothetical protein
MAVLFHRSGLLQWNSGAAKFVPASVDARLVPVERTWDVAMV